MDEAFDYDDDVLQAFRCHLIMKAMIWFTIEAMMEYNQEGYDPFLRAAADGEHPEC